MASLIYQTLPSDQFTLAKFIFKLAKCLHHRRKLQNQLPHRWIKNAGLQSASINPAFTNATAKKNISDIFTNCYSNLQKALVKHYNACIDETFASIQEMSGKFSAAQLRTIHDTVYKWLSTQLHKKLQDDTWCDVQSITNYLLTKRCANSTVWITVDNGHRSTHSRPCLLYTSPSPRD